MLVVLRISLDCGETLKIGERDGLDTRNSLAFAPPRHSKCRKTAQEPHFSRLGVPYLDKKSFSQDTSWINYTNKSC
jgi:hypothetical protein